MQPTRGWLIVLVCVILAGCSSTAGNPTPSRTVSPAPVPSPDAPTTPAPFPPGLTANGVDDPTDLAAAHATALNGSYVLRANQTFRAENGSLLAQRAITVRLGPNHERFYTTLRVRGPLATHEYGTPPIRAEFWSDGEQYLRAVNGTEYGTYTPAVSYSGGYVIGTGEYWVTVVAPGGQPHQDIAPLFSATELRVTSRDHRYGRVRYRLRSVDRSQREPLARIEPVDDIRNLSFKTTVDGRGLVKSYRLTYTGQLYGRTVRVTRTVRYAGVGTTTVPQPAWYDKAVGNATATATGG